MIRITSSSIIRKFLFLDSVIFTSIGLYMYFAPHQIAQLLLRSTPTDGVHWHLLRCIGGQLLATATLTWRCSAPSSSSSSSTTTATAELQTACLLLRLMGSVLGAFVLAHAQATSAEYFEPAIIQSLIWLFVINAFVYLVALLIAGCLNAKSDSYGSVNRWGSNIFCQFDSCMAIAIGFGWAMAPLWLLHKQVLVELDPTHQLCGQIIGVNFLSSHIISTHSSNWGRPSDRAKAAETRAFMILSINLAQIWSQFAYHEHWSTKHSVGISVFVTWTSIALLYRIYLWWDRRYYGTEARYWALRWRSYRNPQNPRHYNNHHHQYQNGGTTILNGNSAMYKKRT